MARYTSITGKDVVLKFNGNEITIPAKGFYETTGEDLSALFPKHVRKIDLSELVEKIQQRLLPPNIKEIPNTIPAPVLIYNNPSIEPPKPTTVNPIIREVIIPESKNIFINPPVEIPLTPIKEVTVKSEEREKIAETMTNLINNTTDPDIKEFLHMIEEILKES